MSINRALTYIFEIYYGHTLMLCSWFLFVKSLLTCQSLSLPVGEEGDKALIDYVCTAVSVGLGDTRGY